MAAVIGRAASEHGAPPPAAADDEAFAALVLEAQVSLAQGVERAGLGRDPYRFMMGALAQALGDFVKRSYPTGLGASFEVIEKLIAGNERAMLAWDKAVRGEHGGNHNPTGRNQHTPEPESTSDVVKLNNIQLDQGKGVAPTGTSAQAGIRRLEKAASAGDGNAADLLRRVVDPASPLPQPHPRHVPVRKLHAGRFEGGADSGEGGRACVALHPLKA